jgi:hypothetical protein
MTTPAPRQLAVIHDYDELLAAIRARRDELQITHETIDDVSGLQPGYTSKLFAPRPIRHLHSVSLGLVLGALGLAIVLVEDQIALARVSGRLVKRERPARKPRAAPPP